MVLAPSIRSNRRKPRERIVRPRRRDWICHCLDLCRCRVMAGGQARLPSGPSHRLGSVHLRYQSLLCVTAIDAAAMTLFLWLGVSLHLAVMRSFDPRRLLDGLVVGSLGLLAMSVSQPLSLKLAHYSMHLRYSLNFPTSRWENYKIEWGPFFIALLVSDLDGTARLGRAESQEDVRIVRWRGAGARGRTRRGGRPRGPLAYRR